METALHPRTETEVPAAETATFLDAVRVEHERLLAALRRAATLIEPGSEQLASLASTHIRLTQRFFDAQRCLLRRRETVDHEIAALRESTGREARALITAAHEELATRTVRRALEASHVGPGEHPVLIEWNAQSAALGAEVVDLEELLSSIGADVRGRDEVSATALQQLGELLDLWWITEQREGRDRLDDATARATMVQHLVMQEVEAIVSSAATDDTMPEPPCEFALPSLPAEMLNTLDGAGDRGLPGLLDDLVAWLEHDERPVDVAPVEVGPVSTALISLDAPSTRTPLPPPSLPAPVAPVAHDIVSIAAEEECFWGDRSEDAVPTPEVAEYSSLPGMLMRAVVPVGLFTALLGLLMAWIG